MSNQNPPFMRYRIIACAKCDCKKRGHINLEAVSIHSRAIYALPPTGPTGLDESETITCRNLSQLILKKYRADVRNLSSLSWRKYHLQYARGQLPPFHHVKGVQNVRKYEIHRSLQTLAEKRLIQVVQADENYQYSNQYQQCSRVKYLAQYRRERRRE